MNLIERFENHAQSTARFELSCVGKKRPTIYASLSNKLEIASLKNDGANLPDAANEFQQFESRFDRVELYAHGYHNEPLLVFGSQETREGWKKGILTCGENVGLREEVEEHINTSVFFAAVSSGVFLYRHTGRDAGLIFFLEPKGQFSGRMIALSFEQFLNNILTAPVRFLQSFDVCLDVVVDGNSYVISDYFVD